MYSKGLCVNIITAVVIAATHKTLSATKDYTSHSGLEVRGGTGRKGCSVTLIVSHVCPLLDHYHFTAFTPTIISQTIKKCGFIVTDCIAAWTEISTDLCCSCVWWNAVVVSIRSVIIRSFLKISWNCSRNYFDLYRVGLKWRKMAICVLNSDWL